MKTIRLAKGGIARVDDDLYEELNRHQWHEHVAGRNVYARCTANREYLHRAVMRLRGISIPHGIDHKNDDGLDCQTHNLRPATQSQNIANGRFQRSRAGYRGVNRVGRKWRARIHAIGHLGYFETAEEAAAAYDAAAIAMYGEFARPNECRALGVTSPADYEAKVGAKQTAYPSPAAALAALKGTED